MTLPGRPKIVVLGMMSRHPVAGIVWLAMQYVIGFTRLGYETYYVEAHGAPPKMFMESPEDDGAAKAAAFLDAVMRRCGLPDKWAFHALHSDGRCYGMELEQLNRLYASAAAIFNLHGATPPLPEHQQGGPLVYVGTDPGDREIALHANDPRVMNLVGAHDVHFTWATNYGNPDCRLPMSERFSFHPTCQPIVLDLWERNGTPSNSTFTTVGSWRQPWRDVTLNGEVYRWSKDLEFMKFLDVPRRTGADFELALWGYLPQDRDLLESHGWRVRDSLSFSRDLDEYRTYLRSSRGEFTVAKDQNVRLRTGWFSDRSASYLAAGCPVITQETGFSTVLPTGHGLFGFETTEDVAAAVEAIASDYEGHCEAARTIAREHFSYDVVLPAMLVEVGL